MNTFYDVMSRRYDSERAYNNVAAIHSFDRWISSDKFIEGAKFCEKAMALAGLSGVEKRELKADGKTLYGDHKLPRAWRAKSATLTVCGEEVLCDYHKIPCSLSMYSASTPRGGVTAELAVIDDLADYSNSDSLKGKILLVKCGSAGAVDFALRVGAVGILCDVFPLFSGIRDSREQMKGVHRWDCLVDNTFTLFAFSLSPDQGDMLRKRAKNEKITLRAEVNTEFTDESLYVINGAIEGTEGESGEIILYGHLNEPGANDNASGCGGLLELFRSLKIAIDEGELPRPKHTLRLVMGPEYMGSIGYIYHYPERKRLCLISADMVGNETADKGKMSICLDPLSNRSFLDGAFALAKQRYNEYADEKMELREVAFWQMSDNFVADPSLHTPAVCMGNYPTESYHSSLDTMERIEADVLKRNILVAGYCAYMLANADKGICVDIAAQLNRQGTELISSAETILQKSLYTECLHRSLKSLKLVCDECDFGEDYSFDCGKMPDYALKDGGKIPVRLVKGPLFFKAHPEIKNNPSMKGDTVTPLQWTDGECTLWEITVRTAAEKKKDNADELKMLFETHKKMFDCLEEHGYIKYR